MLQDDQGHRLMDFLIYIEILVELGCAEQRVLLKYPPHHVNLNSEVVCDQSKLMMAMKRREGFI